MNFVGILLQILPNLLSCLQLSHNIYLSSFTFSVSVLGDLCTSIYLSDHCFSIYLSLVLLCSIVYQIIGLCMPTLPCFIILPLLLLPRADPASLRLPHQHFYWFIICINSNHLLSMGNVMYLCELSLYVTIKKGIE